MPWLGWAAAPKGGCRQTWQLRPGVLEPDDLPDRACGLDESLVTFGERGMHGVYDAVAQVVTEQPDGHFLHGPGAEATWVTTSGHQVSASIIFCRPRTWPSILPSRRR